MEIKKFLSKENLSLLWGKLKSWVESKFSSFESKHFANSNVKVNITVPADAVFTDTNTQYSAGRGIHLNGTQIINTGVNSISAGSDAGILNVTHSNSTGQSYSVPVTVKGLKNRVILGYFKYQVTNPSGSIEGWLNSSDNPDDIDSFTVISTGFCEATGPTASAPVVFPRPYRNPPNVFLTPCRSAASFTWLTASSVSTTGFKITSNSYNGNNWAERFYWLAIGRGTDNS